MGELLRVGVGCGVPLSSIYPLGVYIEGGDAILRVYSPPGVYFPRVEDTPRPANWSGLASTDEGRHRAHPSPMTAGHPPGQPGHIFERLLPGRPQSGQWRAGIGLAISRHGWGPRRHSHRHLPGPVAGSVYPPPPHCPPSQW